MSRVMMACVCDGLNIQLELVCLVDDCVKRRLSFEEGESKRSKTLNSGYLGSRNDEERSEMRYVM